MKRLYISFFVAVLCAVPFVSSAYFTTAQSAHKLSPNSVLFLIEYRFGIGQFDLYMPIFAERDLPHGAKEDKLGYVILEDGATTSTGFAEGIVLSNAAIVDGMYHIPQHSMRKMTLGIVYTIPEDALEADYQLHIQELPFYVGDDREYRKLNPSELQYYTTPEVELNAQNESKN